MEPFTPQDLQLRDKRSGKSAGFLSFPHFLHFFNFGGVALAAGSTSLGPSPRPLIVVEPFGPIRGGLLRAAAA
jgi:hypothetical protein